MTNTNLRLSDRYAEEMVSSARVMILLLTASHVNTRTVLLRRTSIGVTKPFVLIYYIWHGGAVMKVGDVISQDVEDGGVDGFVDTTHIAWSGRCSPSSTLAGNVGEGDFAAARNVL